MFCGEICVAKCVWRNVGGEMLAAKCWWRKVCGNIPVAESRCPALWHAVLLTLLFPAQPCTKPALLCNTMHKPAPPSSSMPKSAQSWPNLHNSPQPCIPCTIRPYPCTKCYTAPTGAMYIVNSPFVPLALWGVLGCRMRMHVLHTYLNARIRVCIEMCICVYI